MLDHLSIQCADVGRSAAFYDTVLEPLGGQRLMDFGDVVGYGVAPRPTFWLGPRQTGEGFRESHIAFLAPDRAAVDAFQAAAVAAGAELLHGASATVPATFEDVAKLIADLPEATEGERHGNRTWFVGKKGFAWERPFNKSDIRRFGEAGVTPPDGPILAVRPADMVEKEAVLAAGTKGIFDMAHFQGYPSVLIQLDKIHKRLLKVLVEDAWLACAPPALADHYMSRQ